MTQQERLHFLIDCLIEEEERHHGIEIPSGEGEQKRLLRSLMNVRAPSPVKKEFLEVQNRYFKEENSRRKTISLLDIPSVEQGIRLFRGDITTLWVDAIVNAANSALLGCFIPCHGCIDNAIHSAAGIELRLECHQIMERQGEKEPVGTAKITKAYLLPSRYVIHTVGPMIQGELTPGACQKLASSYQSCLELAALHNLKSLAFCCISTGEFHFPREAAAQIAINTVRNYLKSNQGELEVVFSVFTDADDKIYQNLLGADRAAF